MGDVPEGFCLCGCGQKTGIAKRSNRARGIVRGQRLPYISSPHSTRHHFAKTRAERFWSKVNICGKDECWEWTGYVKPDGYAQFRFGYPVIMPAHRAAYVLTHGEILKTLNVCHACDNRKCCNPAHLWVGTQADNIRDRDAKGHTAIGEWSGSRLHPESVPRGDKHGRRLHPEAYPRGEKHPMSKLTTAQVAEVRALRQQGVLLRVLAEKYSVSIASISVIARGKRRLLS